MQLAKLSGWTCYHTYRSDKSEPGFPDLLLVRPQRVIFAELKTDRGKLSQPQRRWLELLGGCDSVETYLWRPMMWAQIEKTLAR